VISKDKHSILRSGPHQAIQCVWGWGCTFLPFSLPTVFCWVLSSCILMEWSRCNSAYPRWPSALKGPQGRITSLLWVSMPVFNSLLKLPPRSDPWLVEVGREGVSKG
jgi:hypothetical protein